MRRYLSFIARACLFITGIINPFQHLFAQEMKLMNNFYSFKNDEKYIPRILDSLSSDQAQQHPEYGIRPYNSQCNTCIEMIDQRTERTRFFINPLKPNHIFSQQSYFPLHFRKDNADAWHTIDPRLRPEAGRPGVYSAKDQPFPTECNVKQRSTSITSADLQFVFNRGLSLYFFDEDNAYTDIQSSDYSNYSIGENGLRVNNLWPGIDMQQIFSAGEIETNYVITQPLQLPIQKGWLVLEDHFELPDGYRFVELPGGEHIGDKYFRGNYAVVNANDEMLIVSEKPKYVDARSYGMAGNYELLQNGNNYTLRVLVPISWLTSTESVYPLVIDPVTRGVYKLGDFKSTPNPGYNGFAYTSMPLGSCDYHGTVAVPGKTTLLNTYVDLEYQLTYDNTCGTPNLPLPYCTMSQVSEKIVCDSCHTSASFMCSQGIGGLCTSDSNTVAGAAAVNINSSVPNFLSCYKPQCPNYLIDFTLQNSDSICGDVCDYLCAQGHIWEMMVEACYIEGEITQDTNKVCGGHPVTFTAHPICGVPPYHYIWSPDGGSTFDTIYGSADYVLWPQRNTTVRCVVVDSCDKQAVTNDLSVTVDSVTSSNFSISCAYPGTTFPCYAGCTTVTAIVQDPDSIQWQVHDLSPPSTLDITFSNVDTFSLALDLRSCTGINISFHNFYQICLTAYKGCSEAVHCDTIYLNYKGIDELAPFQLEIYPNPAKDEVNISVSSEATGGMLSLTDILGKELLTQQLETLNLPTGQAGLKLETVNLPSGVYFIKVTSPKGTNAVRKLVIER